MFQNENKIKHDRIVPIPCPEGLAWFLLGINRLFPLQKPCQKGICE